MNPEQPHNSTDRSYHDAKFYLNLRNKLTQFLDRLGFHRLVKEVLLFPSDLVMLLALLLKDKRISIWSKLELFLGLLYIISPTDIIPDYLPGIGILDDLIVFLIVLNHIFNAAGKVDAFLLKGYWAGDQNTLAIVRGFFLIFEKWLSRFIVLGAIYKILSRSFKKPA